MHLDGTQLVHQQFPRLGTARLAFWDPVDHAMTIRTMPRLSRMRILLATVTFVSLLIAGERANATAAGSPNPALGRCIEQPMSLAIAIAEAEAARTVTPRSLVSPSEPVIASPRTPPAAVRVAPPVAPVTPSPRLCLSPDDPRCHVSSLPSVPSRMQLDRIDHGCMITPEPVLPAPAHFTVSVRAVPETDGSARDAHSTGPWRPPAR